MFDDIIQLLLRIINYIRLKFFCKFSYKKKLRFDRKFCENKHNSICYTLKQKFRQQII